MQMLASQTMNHISSYTMPFGVTYLNQSVFFKVQSSNHTECYLKLFHKSDTTKDHTFLMEADSINSNIYTILLDEFDYSEYSYCFCASEKEFLDPTCKLVYAREEFGQVVEETTLRGGFLSKDDKDRVNHDTLIPYHESIMYKLHVRGFTKHESSQVIHKGTYLGVIEKISYLKELGVNSLLFMPMVEFDEMNHKQQSPYKNNGMNYWGFHTDSYYYAPKASYASDPKHADLELKHMINELHKNGIEVLMEMNFTPKTSPLFIVDCLNFWHCEYQVDGFRVSIPVQYRSMIASNPLLYEVKLLDEWWNLDEILKYTDGFIPKWLANYHDGFLSDVRKFLKGDESHVSAFIDRTKYNQNDIGTINYITNHDGFTLADLYSYDIKHNEANGENNYDGREYNYSWNCGVEGVTTRKKVCSLRKRMVKNAFVSMLLSQGTPMILAGDEFLNTQNGNNNAYCQDNDISWLNWDRQQENEEIYKFLRFLIQLRKAHPVFHQIEELRCADYIYCGIPDLSFHGIKAWQPNYSFYSREVGILLCGRYAAINRLEFDDTFYIIYNMHWEPHQFDLPRLIDHMRWAKVFSTDENHWWDGAQNIRYLPREKQRSILVMPRTICVLIGVKSQD